MSKVYEEFGVDFLLTRYAGPTAAEMKMAQEITRLRAERDALKAAAREFLTTLGGAMKTGQFHMNGSADMCHFVRQAMQKLDVLAFDREEKRPVGLERLHEETKP